MENSQKLKAFPTEAVYLFPSKRSFSSHSLHRRSTSDTNFELLVFAAPIVPVPFGLSLGMERK